jgi:hypothetical protein
VPGALAVAYMLLETVPRSEFVLRRIQRSAHLRVILTCLAEPPDGGAAYEALDEHAFQWIPRL